MAETRNYPTADVAAPRTLFSAAKKPMRTPNICRTAMTGAADLRQNRGDRAEYCRAAFLAPPEFAVWLPPGMEHSSHNRKPVLFRTINIAKSLCAGLPEEACLINVSPVFSAIVEDCLGRKMLEPTSEEDLRLCRVLIDQLRISPVQQTYLPTSQDKFWGQCYRRWSVVLRITPHWRCGPARCIPPNGHFRAVASRNWACRLASGGSACAFTCALLLEQGKTVQDVALDVGYSSASAFIVMFQQIAGTTPERFRRA